MLRASGRVVVDASVPHADLIVLAQTAAQWGSALTIRHARLYSDEQLAIIAAAGRGHVTFDLQHVLSMDTVVPDNVVKFRAITNPLVQRIGYRGISATEWTMAALLLAGAWRLFAACGDRRAFIAAKALPALGLLLVFLLYYIGFVAIGGEWFTMWQSTIWNGQQKAVMFLTCSTLVLIVLLLPEQDE